MSSILVRGLHAPSRCSCCFLAGECLWACTSISRYCPISDFPDKHGRLIDADALAAQFKKQIVNEDDLMELCKRAGLMSNYFDESKVQIGMVTFMRMLNDAETIVPAEGGNADG